jgi:ribosomal protein S12 methylthiotransferase
MRYFLDPFGCVKNQVDAETMMAFLNGSGWVQAEDAGTADLIIVNSCGFIESAKRESINAVLSWRKCYPEKKILLAGCLAQRYAPELAGILPEADFLFGNADPAGIGEAARKALGREGESGKGKAVMSGEEAGKRPLLSLPGSAYIKISEGCNNRCAFCAIPLIRGGNRSRTIPDVVGECGALLDRGIKELCLIGQDIGSYGRETEGAMLPELLKSLSALKGEFWVRLLYIHPDNFPLSILDVMEKDPRILPYFDIPFQHGSEKILKAMNRRGNAEAYLALIGTIRRRLPNAVIRSTFMTGFPGETEEDFRQLLDFQEKARPDWLGCFTWSREENTPAYSMKGRVARKTALDRKRMIEERQTPITERQMDRFVGLSFAALVEEKVEGEEGLYLGRLPCQAPEVDGSAVITSAWELVPGTLVRGRVFARAGFDLELRV